MTGGLDTRMILAAKHPSPGDYTCYTYGGMYRDTIDIRIARRIAKACNQEYQVLKMDKTFLSDFPALAEKSIYITDGLADVCKSHELYFSRLARQIAPVKITGKFGSEIIRYYGFLRDKLAPEELTSHDFKQYVSAAKETFSSINFGHKLSFLLFKEIPWLWAGFTTSELSQLMVRSPYTDNEFVNLMYRSPYGIIKGPEFQLDFIRKNEPKLIKIPTNWGLAGSSSLLVSVPTKLAYKFLMTTDKAYNWEKLPYSLHHWVAILDYLFSPLHAEKLIIGFGYYLHYRLWFREQLSQYIKDVLLDSRTLNRPYINKKYLEKIVNDHTNGRGNYLSEINKILSIELTQRVLVEDI